MDALNPRGLALYEAHRPWRDAFGLPVVDLEQYAAHLLQRHRGMTIEALATAGQTVMARNSLVNPASGVRSARKLEQIL